MKSFRMAGSDFDRFEPGCSVFGHPPSGGGISRNAARLTLRSGGTMQPLMDRSRETQAGNILKYLGASQSGGGAVAISAC